MQSGGERQASRAPAPPRYSLVVPFHNEEGNIRPVMEEALAVLRTMDGDFEALLVDDGSTDLSAAELRKVASSEPRCRVISFPANRGQAAALEAGLCCARGEIVLTMDGDGQNDPADFPRLARLVDQGADFACGIRTSRRDSLVRRAMSSVANAVRRLVLHDGVHDAGCQLRAFRRNVVAARVPSSMLQAFLPAMAAAAGYRIAEIPVNHRPRQHGRSKYGLLRLWRKPFQEMMRLRRILRPRGGEHAP